MKKQRALLLLLSSLIGCISATDHSNDPLFYGTIDEPNFIIRWHYQDWCDHVYDPRTDIWRWPTNEEHGVTFNPEEVQPGDVIFVRMIPKFFKKMHPKIKHPYILLTAGECLDKMQDWYAEYLEDEKVIAWFGVHPSEEIVKHPKFHPLPLGILQRPEFYEKRSKMNKFFTKLRETSQKKHLVYLNFAFDEKPERQWLRERFLKESFVKRGERIDWKDYMKEQAESYFVMSPIGRAPDAYRTWEALLVGAIPLVRSTQLDALYEGLPVLIVDDWDEVTEEFLKEKYAEITSQKYDIAPLYWPFWAAKIDKVRHAFLGSRS